MIFIFTSIEIITNELLYHESESCDMFMVYFIVEYSKIENICIFLLLYEIREGCKRSRS